MYHLRRSFLGFRPGPIEARRRSGGGRAQRWVPSWVFAQAPLKQHRGRAVSSLAPVRRARGTRGPSGTISEETGTRGSQESGNGPRVWAVLRSFLLSFLPAFLLGCSRTDHLRSPAAPSADSLRALRVLRASVFGRIFLRYTRSCARPTSPAAGASGTARPVDREVSPRARRAQGQADLAGPLRGTRPRRRGALGSR